VTIPTIESRINFNDGNFIGKNSLIGAFRINTINTEGIKSKNICDKTMDKGLTN
jgi:hypothetical protein